MAAAAAATPATTFLVVGFEAIDRAFDAASFALERSAGSSILPLIDPPAPPVRIGFEVLVLPVELVRFLVFIAVPPREWVDTAARRPVVARARRSYPSKTQERCHGRERRVAAGGCAALAGWLPEEG